MYAALDVIEEEILRRRVMQILKRGQKNISAVEAALMFFKW